MFAQKTLRVKSCHVTHQVLCDDSDLILRRTAPAFVHSDFLLAASACNALWEYSWAVAYMEQSHEEQQEEKIINVWLVAFFFILGANCNFVCDFIPLSVILIA